MQDTLTLGGSDSMQSDKARTIRFMAAAIAATSGIDAKTLLSTDELWNRYVTHATMIYESLTETEHDQLAASIHLCDCGRIYTNSDDIIGCQLCNTGSKQ